METLSKHSEISSYFQADHDRLDALFRRFQALRTVDVGQAKLYFQTFYRHLRRHMVWEEDVLFPFFENKSAFRGSGPTAVMREEHRQIGAALERLHDKVRKLSPDSEIEERELLKLLGSHNLKEENVLYPAIDSFCGDEEVAVLFLFMEQIPQERYQTCCGHQGS